MSGTTVDASNGSAKSSKGWLFFVRWGLGLLLAVFVEIRGMPQKKTLVLLAAGLVACFVMTYGLFRPVGRRGWQWIGLVSLGTVWIGTALGLAPRLLDDNVGNPAELGRFFGLCTLAVPMLGWLGAWSFGWVVRALLLLILSGGFLLFNHMARIDGLSGDESKVSMSWRRGEIGPIASAEASAVGASYEQYLGPNRNARLDDVQIDTDWEKSPPSRIWQTTFEGGLGAFVVSKEGCALTLTQIGKNESIVGFNAAGQGMCQYKYPALFEHGLAKSGPRSTPLIADDKVYAIGALGTLTCLYLNQGEKIWQIETATKGAKTPPYGVASSPLLVDGKLIVCRPSSDGKSVAAYDPADGKLIWEGGNAEAGYSSPLLATLAGVRQIVVFNAENVTGMEIETGSLLWSHPWTNLEKNNCSQPIVIPGEPDRLFVSTGYGKGAVLLAIEKSDDGKLVPRVIWESKQMRNKFSTSFVEGGVVYGLDDGILAAIDLETGKRLWKKDRIGHGQLLWVGGKIIALTESGDLQLIEVSREGSKVLGKVEGALEGKTWNHLALAPPFLFVRNDREGVCFELKLANEPSVKTP
jgi:outer membrane protein assembly factor BamB